MTPASSSRRQTLASLLIGIALAFTPVIATAFDIGPVLDRARMDRLIIAPDEQALAISDYTTGKPYVVVLLGESTFFIDRYGSDNQRISRSMPLPIPRCLATPNPYQSDRLSMAVIELDAGVIISTNPCPSGDTIFFQDSDTNIVSFSRPNGLAPTDVAVTVWVSPKADALDANLTKLWRQMPDPPSGRPYNVTRIIRTVKVGINDASLVALVNRPRASIINRDSHSKAVREAISGLDWRRSSITIETLNNAAFYLAEAGSCADLFTATTMLKHVVANALQRPVANLNLADAYAKAHAQNCPNIPAKLGASQEAFRLYCSAIGWDAVPARVRARFRAALVTPQTENGTRCQPQFAMERALLANDAEALARSLADPENDVDVTFPDGRRALGLALERKQSAMARMLLTAGADPDRSSFYAGSDRKSEFTPIMRAIWNYDVETVAALIGKGQSALSFSMRTSPYRPLLVAAELRADTPEKEAQKLAIMDLILSLEPSPLDTSGDGKSAIYAAADGYSSAAVFERLMKLGVFINKPNNYGQTALFAIGPFQNENAVRTQSILLGLGANPNQQNYTGATPLIHAFGWTRSSTPTVAAMVARLLQAGADPNIADNRGHTALTLAARRAMPDTVDLLIARGAKLPTPAPYETEIMAWLRTRITEIEADPSREADCTCLADYRRIVASLSNIRP